MVMRTNPALIDALEKAASDEGKVGLREWLEINLARAPKLGEARAPKLGEGIPFEVAMADYKRRTMFYSIEDLAAELHKRGISEEVFPAILHRYPLELDVPVEVVKGGVIGVPGIPRHEI